MMRVSVAWLALWCLGSAPPAFAQPSSPSSSEPLRLGALQREAGDADARTREIEMLARQTDLRLRNIDDERLPSINALGSTQIQSDVPKSPFTSPDGQPAFAAPKFTYDASVRVDQRLYDAGIQPRRELARADLAESQARVRTAVFALRQEVNDAFFSAALLQEQLGALTATLDDLDARLRETTTRVREGAALPADAAAIEAAVLQQRQLADSLRSNRRAALARLAALTGRAIGPDAATALPEGADIASQARDALARERARPEYQQFDRARDRAARQQAVTTAADRPQISAFGRAGYGRPGLNFVSDQPEPYALAGLQLQWKAWNWGTSDREREIQALQQTIVSAEEAAFTSSLRRAIETDLAAIEHLETSLATDDRIVALREGIDRTARVRLSEGAITASEYLDRHTEWLTAQFDRARHHVELAQARANVQTKLGLEVR
ncbi:MAG TPA: TolC family protein [Vicinamibacterales bacterium]|nr:TolC family protein [Vicinamibacterales bacterium]